MPTNLKDKTVVQLRKLCKKKKYSSYETGWRI